MGEVSRYQRQMLLAGVGQSGQARLLGSHALVVGCGALGCVSSEMLVRAGVGRLTIVDRDVVELTNLQRQVLFDERDAAEQSPKAEAARRHLARINSGVRVRSVVADFSPMNAERLIAGDWKPDVILDGTDNFETRYLLNDVAVKHGIAFVYAGVVAASGMSMSVLPGETACLRCVFREMPAAGSQPTCDTAGVLGPAVSIVAGYQAAEALKILLGLREKVMPSLLTFDLWEGTRSRLDLREARDAACPCCGLGRYEFLEGAGHEGAAVSLCGRGVVQVSPPMETRVDLGALARRLGCVGRFRVAEMVVTGELDEERGEEGEAIGLTVFEDGRALVRGVRSAERARAIYARYVGA